MATKKTPAKKKSKTKSATKKSTLQRGRPFKKGQSGNPAGKKPGTKSYKTLAIEEKLESLGCDPIKAMVELAEDKNTETSIRAKLYCELANYIYPKRKATELSGSIGRNNAEEMTVDEFANLSEEEKIARNERDLRRNSEAIERARKRLGANGSASVQ